MNVEQLAIMVATEYADANGYTDDPRAVGLVLAGMTIAAAASETVRGEILAGYLRELPVTADAIRGWARALDQAAAEEVRREVDGPDRTAPA